MLNGAFRWVPAPSTPRFETKINRVPPGDHIFRVSLNSSKLLNPRFPTLVELGSPTVSGMSPVPSSLTRQILLVGGTATVSVPSMLRDDSKTTSLPSAD